MIISKKKTFEQHDNETISYYRHSVKSIEINDILQNNLDVDVCIIGAGFTGVSSALNLANKGYKVVILEAKKIGWGASGRNGGQLGNGMRRDQFYIEKKLGLEHAKELWNLGLEAVQEVKDYISKYNIDCDIIRGILTAGFYKSDSNYFFDIINHMQKKYNFENYEYFNSEEIKKNIDTNKYYSGLLNKSGYHIHPLKFLYGLVNQLIKLQVPIYQNTPAIEFQETSNGVKILSKKFIVNAKYAVVGCNGYLDNLLGKIRYNFMPINNYIIATETIGKENAQRFIKNNYAVHDTRFIIDYYRFSKDYRMIFGGGETFTSKFLNNSKQIVAKRMYEVFPNLSKYKIDFNWGGTLAITINRLPDFGSLMNDKILYAQGYSGHGIALSILSGKLIAEKISGFSDRFYFFQSIKHLAIPGGDLLRRPIYSSAIAFYKLRDFLKI